MNRFEIRDILDSHKEHFRVLPTGAMNAVLGIIDAVNSESDVVLETPLPIEKETKRDVGRRTRKAAKKSKRSKR